MKKRFFESALAIDHSFEQTLTRRSQHIMAGRLILFFAAILIAAAGWDQSSTGLYALALAIFIAFLRLLQFHDDTRRLMIFTHSHTEVLQEYLDRWNGRWHKFPETGKQYLRDEQPQGLDLSLFGSDSIYQYICTAHTKHGRDRLAAALSPMPPDLSMSMHRQQGADAFIRRTRLSVDLQAISRLMPDNQDTTPLIEALEKRQLPEKKILHQISWILPAASGLSILLSILGYIHWSIPCSLLLLQFALSLIFFNRHTAALAPLFHLQHDLQLYYYLFDRLEQSTFPHDSYLDSLIAPLRGSDGAAHSMRQLYRLSEYANMRRNLFFALLANTLLLWDFHCYAYFVAWKQHTARNIRHWLGTWSEIEVLMSLAVIGQTRQTYIFPTLLPDEAPHIEARSLSYLLLPEELAIPNDTDTGSATFIITGSNMSGKTTYLRTLASSVILAYAGAPVCAQYFSLTHFRVFTSIRVTDDITRGLSTFYAELLRIKSMVEFSREKMPMLICIDEIFKGTNSADRIIGAREAINRLTNPWSITMVSTHDFELCELQSPNDTPVCNYHFAEHYEGDKILFDYKIKPGRCQTTNARYLLKMAGIMD